MIVLAIDTALETCSAAVLDGDRVAAARSEPMSRGHQERLAPLVREVMAEAGAEFAALDRIGVTVGPGSFTGLRVGLAFAKGLGLALGRPVVGVGTLEVLAASAADAGLTVAAVDAKRGQFWLQVLDDGRPLTSPEALDPAAASRRLLEVLGPRPCTLVGSAAEAVASALPGAAIHPRVAPDPAVVARLAAAAPEPLARPRPLYLRAPDARLPGGLPPA